MNKNERMLDFRKSMKAYDNVFGAKVSDLIDEKFLNYLDECGFFTAPASTKYHGAYEGGLYDHSKAVFERICLLTVNNKLDWQRKESPFIVGMFHDLCKCDQYVEVPGVAMDIGNGNVLTAQGGSHYEHNKNILLKGHGAKSVMLLSQFITLTEEEILCIRYHMGAYETEEWNEFDRAIRAYETVLYSHTADMLASKVDGV